MKTVILDIDGTLVDSNDAHAHAWVAAFAAAGITVDYDKVRRSIGMGGDKLMPAVAGIESDSKEGQRISKARGEIFKHTYLPALRPFASVRELMERFIADGYGLAVASSYLDRRDDAIREFRWVLQYGRAGSAEVEASRQWLVQARALPPAAYAVATPNRPEKERSAGNASLEGRATFAEAGRSPRPLERMQLFLVGQPNSPTQRERYNLRTDEQGNFKFPDVVPGPYKLTDRVAGTPTWRMRVELQPSEVTTLELTPDNSTRSHDDFPEPQAQAR